MRIIISPAKKMNVDNDSFMHESIPHFITETEHILAELEKLTDSELKLLWKCNDEIASLNMDRLKNMNLQENLTPAVLSYDGIQYKYMAPSVLEQSGLDYIKERLIILSGFYGVLRAFDGVVPYRLEMQAKLKMGEYKNLYQFWGERVGKLISKETDVVLNLASKEYSEMLRPNLDKSVRFIDCVFGEMINGKIIEKGTICKMARGRMVRYLAENNISEISDIKSFDELGYQFSAEYSGENKLVFIKEKIKEEAQW